jgi:hypothetical protein
MEEEGGRKSLQIMPDLQCGNLPLQILGTQIKEDFLEEVGANPDLICPFSRMSR